MCNFCTGIDTGLGNRTPGRGRRKSEREFLAVFFAGDVGCFNRIGREGGSRFRRPPATVAGCALVWIVCVQPGPDPLATDVAVIVVASESTEEASEHRRIWRYRRIRESTRVHTHSTTQIVIQKIEMAEATAPG